jgi:hypothetical protein
MRQAEDWKYILGTGHWEAFRESKLDMADIHAAGRTWAAAIGGVQRPWLCWNVDHDWCLVQQKLVREVGWTPVVGFDPRVGPPPLVDGAICVDFNAPFGLPTMWLHFPLEFIFLFCDRIAFWHADLIMRRDKIRAVAERFASLPDGTAAAVVPNQGRLAILSPKKRRYWEVLGCSTRGSSRDQFENGCGWWRNFWMHPSTPASQAAERETYYYDSGAGIRFWHKKCRGRMTLIPERYVSEGHCTRIGRKDYVEASKNDYTRDLSKELSLNTDLREVCDRLGVGDLVGETGGSRARRGGGCTPTGSTGSDAYC